MPSQSEDSRAVSETLGVAVLIGMTLLVTMSLGLGVLLISEQDQAETAQIDFSLLSNRLAVVYEDEQPRQAGRIYFDGPDNNVSWAELDDEVEPGDNVEQGDGVFLGAETPYGFQITETDTVEVVYFNEEGERLVVATWNQAEEGEGQGPDGGPGGQDPGGGPGGQDPGGGP